MLKVKSGEFYGASCTVPRCLSDQGIESVVAPLRTRTDDLWTRAGEWTVLVYPYVEGQTPWAGMSEDHWKTAGAIFRRIHEVALPPAGFDGVRRETFDASGYARATESIERHLAATDGDRKPEQALRGAWAEHRSTIYALLTSMDKLARVLQSQTRPHVICHADLHPGNLLRDRAGNVFVVDWDDVMLAPRERDFIFAGEPADGSAQGSGSPFFEGYGEMEIDWTLLTYYRYERVITDLIEDAQQVLLRDDLSEQAKAEAARQVRASLEGRNFDSAQAAAAHIPEDLTVHE